MTAKAKAAKKQDVYRTILLDMLKEPENKVCGDCGAKGPRWASWNIGVYVCIRCAGIHRNLGVHISKVKSVNLDTWTEEQIESISAKGNGIVNDFYECNMPESMRRPVDDYSAETFIRAKYEQKKFIPRRSPADSSGKPKEKKEKKPRQSPAPVKKAPVKTVKTTVVTQPPKQQPRHLSKSPAPISQPPAPSKPAPDLLGAAPSPANVATSKPSVDLLFMGGDGANSSGQMASAAGNPAVSQQKDSIMSLYGAQQQQQQQYPGFVGQQQARMMPAAAGQMGMGSYGANPMSVYTQQQLQYQQMQQQQFLQAQQVQQQMARLRLEQQQGQHGSLMGGMGNSGGWPSPVQQRNMTATTGHTMSNQLWQ
ncbi:stromal membrane-associated protein 2-like [Oscarella lobularis]|uniref:stromal membrane-associated protein 2-like n=1 Tax=Oscarella lobularis TaxID=121494 RepID=UPI0033133D32